MFGALAKAVFGSANDRYVRSLDKTVAHINALEPVLEGFSDEELQAQTAKFREQLAGGKTLDDVLPEAFATVREASRRVLGMRHFDVQMVGGMVLHRGEIAEMRTGEGKTLVATLATYLNAIEGKGVHVVTVNDYLARRDAEWMGKIHKFLGLTVGVIVPNLPEYERREAYACDITYGTNNEFGFDYLRDNMKHERTQQVHRPFNYAIVDEVDSILIDEARTPLIISGPTEDKSDLYLTLDTLVKTLPKELYEADEKSKSVSLTEEGVEHVEQTLIADGALATDNLYDVENTLVVHHLDQALRANVMFKRDTDYIVKEGKIIIIDEFTGRMMDGRRWSNGLHQAVEAKEGVKIEPENQTMATITFQNYFRMYPKLSGMTGTAATEAAEFWDIYKLNVVEIPTNVPVLRIDEDDEFYKNTADKFQAIAKAIGEKSKTGQPVLVGTVSIEKSELLSSYLDKEGVKHAVLNARFHEQEAHIVAQAGRMGAVTIATNMAGRGTDIQLGGNVEFRIEDELKDLEDGPKRDAEIERIKAEVAAERQQVLAAGGLFVLGTERHEARRIDNQLRGRSGRQGDPGETRFYLSGQDDLVRLFAGDRIFNIMARFKIPDDQPMEAKILSNQIENAQKKVEEQNFVMRKNVLKYDDVLNKQRTVIYEQRRRVLEGEDLSEEVRLWVDEVIERTVEAYTTGEFDEEWDLDALCKGMEDLYATEEPITPEELREEVGVDRAAIVEEFQEDARDTYAEKEQGLGLNPETQLPLLRDVERFVILQVVDTRWREHLENMDYLREGVHLRAMAQKDPLVEYTAEGHRMFEELNAEIREEVVRTLFHAEIEVEEADQLQQAQAAQALNDDGFAYA